MFCYISYAYEINSSYEVDLRNKESNITRENISYTEKNDLLSVEKFIVKSKEELNRDSINLFKYSDLKGDYVSLRDAVEIIGGEISWKGALNDNYKYNYGYININQKIYKYLYSARDDYNIKTKFSYMSFYYIDENEKEKDIVFSSYGPITIKFKDNMLLIPADQLMCLLNRFGYIYTFDFENKIFRIEKYDFIKENEIVKKLFPKTNDLLYYDSEETLFNTEVLGEDFYTNICGLNQGTNVGIWSYFDEEYKPYKEVLDYVKKAKLCYKGYYSIDTDDKNITVEYNADINCYIAYNNKCNVDSPEFKMIAIRCFDGQVIYVYD